MGIIDKYSDRIMESAMKVQSNKYLNAIALGLMATLPINLMGSVALLLMVLPVDFWQSFLGTIGLTPYLSIAFSVTVGIISVYASFLIGYQLSENFEQRPVPGGLVSLFSFLMLTPLLSTEEFTTLDSGRLGATGLFAAMISALIFARIYVFFAERKIGIKMPEGVPPNITSVFEGAVPVILSATAAMFLAFAFGATSYGSFSDFVYSVLAAPLQGLSSNVGSLIFIVLIQMIFWFFGIHGSNIVGGFVDGLYLPMDVQNMEALQSGTANSDLPNILGKSFYSVFSGIGGAGGTLSLIIVVLMFAKSQQYTQIAKLSLVPGLFTINEPIVFGLPLVLNPILAVPFILTPLVQTLVAYLGIASGLFPRLSGVQVPFGLPVGLNGFIAGGWRIAVLQVICIAVGCLLYYPFVKISDKRAVAQEVPTVAE